MYSQLPLRILEAVGLLHRLGYAGLRILPGMNASGTAWRIIVFNVLEWKHGISGGDPYSARESCIYSTASGSVLNEDCELPTDVSHVVVAEEILKAMPSLQRTTLDETGNQAYVLWYAMLCSQIRDLRDLPIAYADYFDDSEGWELGWGSKRRVCTPPVYEPPLPASLRSGSDEYYVLELCDQVLGSRRAGQKTFEWLVGDPSKKTGQRKLLPVDGYWEDFDLAVEYHERQHTESVPFFDDKITASGILRGKQRKIYDQRKARLLPEHGVQLVVIDYSEFTHKKGKIVRVPSVDREIIRDRLTRALEVAAR